LEPIESIHSLTDVQHAFLKAKIAEIGKIMQNELKTSRIEVNNDVEE
jgi:hypothetical protein